MLQDNEEAEKEKAKLWLGEKKTEISAEYEKKASELLRKKELVRQETVKESEKKAAGILNKAHEHAERLRGIPDDTLLEVLKKRLVSIIAG